MNAERYNFSPVLQSLEENTNKDYAIISEDYLDLTIYCIPLEYTIKDQLDSTSNLRVILIPTVVSSYPETSHHQYSQVPTIKSVDNLPISTLPKSKPILSPSTQHNTTRHNTTHNKKQPQRKKYLPKQIKLKQKKTHHKKKNRTKNHITQHRKEQNRMEHKRKE